MVLWITVAIYRHGDSQRYGRLARRRITTCRVDSAFNVAQSSHAKKKTSCRHHGTRGNALIAWHGFAPNSRASSMDASFRHGHSCVQKVASLLQKMRLPEVRILPIRPRITSALQVAFSKEAPYESRVFETILSLRLKRTGAQSLFLQSSSTVHWHKQTTVHFRLKVHPRQT